MDGDVCADIFFFALTGRHARRQAGFRGLQNSHFRNRVAEIAVSKIRQIETPIAPVASSVWPPLLALSLEVSEKARKSPGAV
jgi:hypothetical protein